MEEAVEADEVLESGRWGTDVEDAVEADEVLEGLVEEQGEWALGDGRGGPRGSRRTRL